MRNYLIASGTRYTSMKNKTQILLALITVGIFDAVIPFFPILALILAYVLLERPPWFLDWVQEIYRSR